jgi:UDP-N-acetylglucosamine 2-epimerase
MEKIKILTVIGASPQFIESAAFSYGVKGDAMFEEIIAHIGQH